MSGEETFRHLRTIRSNVRVILSSGYNEVEAVKRFTGTSLTGFIQKPYTSTQLAQKVRDALNERASYFESAGSRPHPGSTFDCSPLSDLEPIRSRQRRTKPPNVVKQATAAPAR
jgi:DNA-binding NtrC family response regulator